MSRSALQVAGPVPAPSGATVPEGGSATGRPHLTVAARRPQVALVHDYLTQRGGAERVVLQLRRAFPNAPLHTSLFAPETTYPEFADGKVHRFPIDQVAFFRRNHRSAFPVLAAAFSRYTVEADVVLCSSSGWAHGVRTDGRKVVYCHAPARWLYQSSSYLRGRSPVHRAGLAVLKAPLRRWDRRAAATADRYLANSSAVRDQIRRAYGIDAEVLPPPPLLDTRGPCEPVAGLDDGFLLVVARLLPYKNVDAVVEAVRGRPEQLVVVGVGPEAGRLAELAGPNVRFLGTVSDAELRWLYARARALVSASYEDFGLTTLEAAAYGTPTVALRFGGFLDTVVEGETGLLFDSPEAASVRRALDELERTPLDPAVIAAHAGRYDQAAFAARLRSVVAETARS